MPRFEVKTDAGQVVAIDADSPETAAARVADLYQVTVVATRPSREAVIRVGIPEGS
jgi:hypothetical protein